MTNEIPTGWRLARFDEVLTKVDRKFIIDENQEYKTVGVRWYGNGTFVRERLFGANINRKQQWEIRTGDIVYNKLFAWKGAFAIADESVNGCIVSDKFPTYNVKPDLIEPTYLSYFFTTTDIALQAQDLSKGAAALSKLTLNPPQFWDLKIPLPPLDEQRRILKYIETLATRIAKAQSLQEETELEAGLLFNSILGQTFEKLENEYQSREIQQVCDVVRGGSPRPAGDIRFYGGDIPFIKVGDITNDDGKFLYSAIASVNEEGKKQSRFIQSGTLMLTNSGATLGVPKIIKIDGCFNDGSQAFLNLDPEIFSEYLYYFFKSKTKWFRDVTARGQGQPNLNTDMVRPMKFPVPPLDEQQRIVAYLDSVQARLASLRELQSATGEELSALLPSVLDRAFKGEL